VNNSIYQERPNIYTDDVSTPKSNNLDDSEIQSIGPNDNDNEQENNSALEVTSILAPNRCCSCLKNINVQIIVVCVFLLLVSLFKFYSGYFMKPLLDFSFDIPKTSEQSDGHVLKILRLSGVNFVSELVLMPRSYDFKLITAYLSKNRYLATLIIVTTQPLALFILYKIFKKSHNKVKSLALVQNLGYMRDSASA
jgi:hypothetical protein